MISDGSTITVRLILMIIIALSATGVVLGNWREEEP